MTKLDDYAPVEFLTDDETIAHYLAMAADESNPEVLRQALVHVACARANRLTALGATAPDMQEIPRLREPREPA